MTVLAGLSDSAGLFDLVGERTARLARGRSLLLFVIVCCVLTVVTATLSLDTTAVLMTPVVLALAERTGLAPLPFALAAIWLANATSLLLPVSNLTNLLATHSGARLGTETFARRMALPEFAALVVVIAVLALRFRRELSGHHRRPEPYRGRDPLLTAVAALCCVVVAPAALLGVAPWKVAVPAAVVLSGVSAVRQRQALRVTLVPWRLVLLTEGLFLIVAALSLHGLDGVLRHAVGASPLRSELVGAGLANVVNNLPAYLAVAKVIPSGQSTTSLALLIGTNAGAMLTLYGSLATLLWRERVRARGLEVSAAQFLRAGLLVVPLLLAACYGALLIT